MPRKRNPDTDDPDGPWHGVSISGKMGPGMSGTDKSKHGFIHSHTSNSHITPDSHKNFS